MKLSLLIVILVSLLSPGIWTASRLAAANCDFTLGFKALHDLKPDIIGDRVVDQRYSPENGDGLQETRRGLLVWRKADNFSAFTDGFRTWVNGPFGIEARLNSERFQFEALQQLRNGELRLPLVDPQDLREKETPIRLVNGEFTLSSPPQRIRAGLVGDFVATGDLDGDGTPDAVAPLFLNTGGSGVFIYLFAMVDRNDGLVQVGRELLGDRVKLNSIAVSGDGTIAIDMITQVPNDPLCCPTQQVTRRFRLEGDKLVRLPR